MKSLFKFLALSILSVGLFTGVTAGVTGCASMATPTTPKEQIYASVKQAEALANTAHRLYEADVITTDTYSDVLHELRNANEALGNARAMLEAGKALEAEDRVEVANMILMEVRNALKRYEERSN